MKRKIRFRNLDGKVVECTLGEYIVHDIGRASYLSSNDIEGLQAQLDTLQGYFSRLLSIMEPDLSHAEIRGLCEPYDRFEIVEVSEEGSS